MSTVGVLKCNFEDRDWEPTPMFLGEAKNVGSKVLFLGITPGREKRAHSISGAVIWVSRTPVSNLYVFPSQVCNVLHEFDCQ